MIAVWRVRRRMLRSARPLAMASGSGSLCSRIRTRSASEKIALILLNLLPGDRPSELHEERRAGQLGQGQAGDFGEVVAEVVGALGVLGAGAEHPDQRAAGGAHRLQDLAKRPAAVVLDDDAGAGREVGAHVGIDTFRVAMTDAETGIVEPPGERRAFDEHIELAAGGQDGIEQPDHQLRVADREAPHSGCDLAPRLGGFHNRQPPSIRLSRRRESVLALRQRRVMGARSLVQPL